MKWKLKAIMDEHNDSMVNLAEHLEITYQTLSKKLNGSGDFTRTEIKKMAKRYSLGAEQIYNIFFQE